MTQSVFITSTDTSVGKTAVSRALIQALQTAGHTVMGYKPVARGEQLTSTGWQNNDALQLQALSSVAVDYSLINPIASDCDSGISGHHLLMQPVLQGSVHHSVNTISTNDSLVNYGLLSDRLQQISQLADYVVVEGSGGWRSLLHDLRPLSEWVIEQQLPVILVVGIQTGCVNHALLTAQAIISDGLALIGWIANRINPGLAHYAGLINILNKKIPAPRLGELPYLPRLWQRDLSQYINLPLLTQALVCNYNQPHQAAIPFYQQR